MPRLAGKVAFITGAGSRIGRATAILFAGEGAKIAIAEIDARTGEETPMPPATRRSRSMPT
jgi:NAD(P)-dependent dehydrogenase (short-subunit alcohol dehydrogenase family)